MTHPLRRPSVLGTFLKIQAKRGLVYAILNLGWEHQATLHAWEDRWCSRKTVVRERSRTIEMFHDNRSK